eukprot:TRINITY_DN12152_c0_g1_i2.p1 TRINITY_DN12152_c0_g1~~TRINITY_DN12152_c0_g1_i2.p1  ORF type:complete len:332 (-),score=58.72 TRINITY_DN12152_c0_g1_i2:11-1006(-)
MLRLKRWHYTSVVVDGWFLGFAVFHGSYISEVFAYLARTDADGERWEYSSMMPLGLGVSMSPSSNQGCTTVTGLIDSSVIRVCAQNGTGWKIDLDLPVVNSISGAKGQVVAGFVVDEPIEPLALLIPLRGTQGQLGYTLKAAGLHSEGKLSLRSDAKEPMELTFSDGLAAVDWTKQLAKRETVWRWVSLSARALIRTAGLEASGDVGINFSIGEFDDESGVAQENAVWVAGKLHLLGEVHISPLGEPTSDKWRIHTSHSCDQECDAGKCGCVEMEFSPMGARRDGLSVGVLKSVFVQPYGTFTGMLRLENGTVVVLQEGAFGVTEDHVAVW